VSDKLSPEKDDVAFAANAVGCATLRKKRRNSRQSRMTFLRIAILLYLFVLRMIAAQTRSAFVARETGTRPRVKPEGMLFRIMAHAACSAASA